MKIHEYQAAEILRRAGLPVPGGYVTSRVEDAVQAAGKLGYPVVLKAQVLVGGRGKAGGIKVVRSPEELKEKYADLKQLTIKGYPVEKIFVVQGLDIHKEFYVAVTIDPAQNDVVVIASSEGGVDIEDVARNNPGAIHKFYLRGQRVLPESGWMEFISGVFETSKLREDGERIIQGMVKVLFDNDASLVEVNPLIVDGHGNIFAADAKINFDDNGLVRHPELAALRDLRYEDADELEAKENSLSFVKLEGNVGCIVNGAGLAMGTMDVIKLSGGQPANFLDVGGSSSPEKVLNALRIILRNKDVRAILINIFGGITRCDDIAKGILAAREQMDLPVPLVVRLTGTNEDEAKELLAQNGVEIFSTMREAVDKVVALARS
jgi:succinyl-CoA synthetase beta subunit